MMKRAIILIVALACLSLIPGKVFAFSCPKLAKAANEAIAKAESRAANVTEEREKRRAMANIALAKDLVQQSVADHNEARAKKAAELHYRAEAKAKAAKALADQVK
jgi:hypothetical protein